MRNKSLLTEKEQQIFSQFQLIDKDAKALFEPYRYTHVFGDTGFSLMYTWEEQFHYAYRFFGEHLVVLEKGIDDRLSCILLRKEGEHMDSVVEELYQIFEEAGLPLYFEYVAEQDLCFYRQAIEGMGKQMKSTAKEEDSDYIYETEAFLSLDGKENKRKRGDLNHLNREFSDIYTRFYDGKDDSLKEDCRKVFEQWCGVHDCENCFYGCEKQACLRFFDIFDEKYNQIAVSYADGKPLSFAISERMNADTVCYFFQKNAKKVRGLTYWLNREMALRHTDVKYINLGEDMGLSGLREDKTSLHPCERKKKYFIKVQ